MMRKEAANKHLFLETNIYPITNNGKDGVRKREKGFILSLWKFNLRPELDGKCDGDKRQLLVFFCNSEFHNESY